MSAKSCVRREPLTEIVYDRAAETAAVYEIEDALNLESINPKLRRVVELCAFEGLTGDETGERLDCAPATITRRRQFAREWPAKEFAPIPPIMQERARFAPELEQFPPGPAVAAGLRKSASIRTAFAAMWSPWR